MGRCLGESETTLVAPILYHPCCGSGVCSRWVGWCLCFLKGMFRLHGQDRVSKAVMDSKPKAYAYNQPPRSSSTYNDHVRLGFNALVRLPLKAA